MSENFNEQNENNQNEYGTSQNIYGNTQTTYGDTQNSYGSENNYGGTQNSYGGTQNTYGYNNQPQYQSGMENQQQELVPQMSVGQWMLTYLLVNIPIVNIVMYIIWLIGKNPKDAIRKNWARGQLFMGLIIFGIMLIFTIIALTVSTLVGGSSSGSSKIDTGVTSDYYAADDDGDQAEDIFNHDSGAATLPDTSEDRPVVDAEPMDGTWKFHFVPRSDERPMDFFQKGYDVSGWDDIKVPSNWELQGFGYPFYVGSGYGIKKNPPLIAVENSPVGSYRRTFTIPAHWNKRQIILYFGGVASAFYVWVNGEKVGYSQDSKTPSEFDITPYVKQGENEIAVQVFKFSDGYYLEDQDYWRFAGIQRDVYVYARSETHVRDYEVVTDLDGEYKNADFHLSHKPD
mgnify:CR=1 FL=1